MTNNDFYKRISFAAAMALLSVIAAALAIKQLNRPNSESVDACAMGIISSSQGLSMQAGHIRSICKGYIEYTKQQS